MEEKQIVEDFAGEMLRKIEKRRDRYVPLAWRTLDFKRLISLLYAEISELQDAMKEGDKELAASDCADIANYACFIHDLIKRE